MGKVWLILTLMGVMVLGMAAAPGPADTPATDHRDDLKARVARLEKALKVAQGVAARQGLELAALRAWAISLPAKVEALKEGLAEARNLGFTAAGANPRAKEALLSSLGNFGRDLATGLPERHSKKKGS